MGNAVSRPSCLGERSRRSEDPLDPPVPPAAATVPEKPLVLVENGWSAVAGGGQSPLGTCNPSAVTVRNGGTASWTPPPWASAHRSGVWSWPPVTAREVTEVTEVTETIVTEIVEVTEYPERGAEPPSTRTVAVLTELPAGDTAHKDAAEVSLQAVLVSEEVTLGVEPAQDAVAGLLAWVADMEQLVGNQRPPSAEAKVATAQLEEQKLLKRLLEERRLRVELVLQGGAVPPAHGPGTVAPDGSSTVEPDRSSTTASDGITAPDGPGTAAPDGSSAVAPNGPGTVAPNRSSTVAPDGSGTVAPNGPGTMAPDGSGTVAPDGSGTLAPDGSGTVAPNGPGTMAPDGSGTVAPDGSGTVAPDGSGTTAPDGSGTAARDRSGTVAPNGSGITAPDGSGTAAPDGSGTVAPDGITGLGERWGKLVQEAEARFVQLERIVPVAQSFQAAAGSFQEWLVATEQQLVATERLLAQLWCDDGCSARTQEAHRETQALCEEIRGRVAELDDVLESGQRVVALVTGEEARLAQERLESLRLRYQLVGQSSGDAERRLAQTLEAMSRLDAAHEDLARWLARMEEELGAADGHELHVGDGDWEKLEQVLVAQLSCCAALGERLEVLGAVQLDTAVLQVQLSEQKLVTAEILQLRGLAERLLGVADPLLHACPEPLRQRLQASAQALRERSETLSQRGATGAAQLELAQALLAQFAEAHQELEPWLQEMDTISTRLDPSAGTCEGLREQQALLQSLREALAEHRPLLGKLQRVSAQLAELSPEQGAAFRRQCQDAEERYGRVRDHVRQAAALLEDTLPRYSQLSERAELLGERLERLQSRLQSRPPARADAAHLRERLRETGLALGELEELGVALAALEAQGTELRDTMRAASADTAATGVQERLAALRARWQQLREQCQEQERQLRELVAVAERFWQGVAELALALGDTQHLVLGLDDAGGEPEDIQSRLRTMEALREEVEALPGELDALGGLGVELAAACGDPDRPHVTRSLDELYSSWHSLSRAWGERVARLQEQLQAAVTYRDSMQRLQEWLEAAELRVAEEFLVGGDAAAVQQQLEELKEFKRELYQSKVDVESLRHPGGTGHGDPPAPLIDFRQRWDRLEEEVVSRQHELEAALLGLGQFQQQLQELRLWLHHAAEQLQDPPPLRPDLPACEIQLATHTVLRNDVLSHARTVQAVLAAGEGLLQAGRGDSEGLQRSLRELSHDWDLLRGHAERRHQHLEEHLGQVQEVTLELTTLLQWLEQVELQLCFSRPAWGHPEATREMLNAHLELCRELEARQGAVGAVRERLRRLGGAGGTCSTEHSLRVLEHKWDSVRAAAQDRRERLSEGLAAATEFHGRVQELLRWAERTEGVLGCPPPPSCLLDTVTAQIRDHKALVQEAQAWGDALGTLEALAWRLQEGGGRQEGAAVQNLLLAARERLHAVLQHAGERGVTLEEARKRAKQFSESRRLLLDWMDEVEPSLQPPPAAATNQEEIQRQLAEIKVFQKELRGKRALYEATLRLGRGLREGTQCPEDLEPLEQLLGGLRERWDALGGRAAERQQRLEEQLLFSGRFWEALQALMDWLYRAEPQLSEDAPVGGDRDLVTDLMDKHKVLQKELGQRAGCVRMLRRSGRELVRGSSGSSGSGDSGDGDAPWVRRQLEELGARWDLVCRLSVAKQGRLEAALRQAEEFHALVQAFLRRLAEAEQSLRFGGSGGVPEEEAAVRDGQEQLQELLGSLQCRRLELECVTSLGDEILATAHPDAIVTVRSWVTVANSRFQEVWGWAQQAGERLRAQAAALAVARGEAAQLGDWMAAAEEALALRDRDPLPQDPRQLEELQAQHAVFVEELNHKQPDVEKVTKSCQQKMSPPLAPPPARRLATRRRSAGKAPGMPAVALGGADPQTPAPAQLLHRWQQLWLRALDRQHRLDTAQQRLHEEEALARFDFGAWRARFVRWIAQNKSRALDVFRGIDRDQRGRVTRRQFIQSILASKFPTTELELGAVAAAFDADGDGFIDYGDFVSALHPQREAPRRPDAQRIQDEVNRQVAQCSCAKRFQVEQISANRYRFGESQQLRMVRILRSTLMVRVGGGWTALDEFLVKNDPCRVKGRTNLKINEKYLSPDPPGATKGGGTPSAPPSKALSRSRSSSSLYSSASAPCSPQPRKSVPRRTRSGDRCPPARGSETPDSVQLSLTAAEEIPPVAPTEPPEGSPPQRRSPCR